MTGHRDGPQLAVIWWRDIPAQLVARDGTRTVKVELPGRFQAAIDQVAMAAGLTGSGAYLEQWNRQVRPCSDRLEAEVDAEAASLQERFPPAVLAELVRSARPAPPEAR